MGRENPDYSNYAYCPQCERNHPIDLIRCPTPECKNRRLRHTPYHTKFSKKWKNAKRY